MSNLRSGKFGDYYGSFFNESEPLSTEQQKLNATYIYSYLTDKGWSINAISAILGNMQAESSINPGRWQNDDVGNTSNGYGLVQWTPATNYINWVTGDASTMDNNLSRIIYEVENGLQRIDSNYELSFKNFTTSNDSPSNLAKAFLLKYERPKDQSNNVQNLRASNAEQWYSYLSGTEVNPSVNDNVRKNKYNFLLFTRGRRNEQRSVFRNHQRNRNNRR